MGIINITLDSFYAQSRFLDLDKLLKTVENFVNNGAEILDIGGQSTRPGYDMISWEEELDRILVPVMEIKKRFEVSISVDTFYSQVAEEVLKQKVDMINDVSGLDFDKNMVDVIARYDAAVCLVHNSRGDEKYSNTIEEIIASLKKKVERCIMAGIDHEKICIDAGIGFGKTLEQNWNLLNNYEKLHELKLPLLLGASRKSFLGGNVEDRLQKTLETTKLAIEKDVRFVRVHDVKENFQLIRNFRI